MTEPCTPPVSDSYLQIDNFLMNAKFHFEQEENKRLGVQTDSADGTLHTVDKYQKEQFTVEWPELTQAESDELRQILSQVGINVFHTIIYSTPELLRKWDSVTPPGYNVNTDINRIRKKVYCKEWEMPHHRFIANTYRATASFVEG